jgi:hypothetical protein
MMKQREVPCVWLGSSLVARALSNGWTVICMRAAGFPATWVGGVMGGGLEQHEPARA